MLWFAILLLGLAQAPASPPQPPLALQEPLQSLMVNTEKADASTLRKWSAMIWDSGIRKEDFCPDYEHPIVADLFNAAADRKEKPDPASQAIAEAKIAIDTFSLMSARPGYSRDDFKKVLAPAIDELQKLANGGAAPAEAADWLKKLEGRRLMTDQPLPGRVRISVATSGGCYLLRDKATKPIYPSEAKMARITGSVIMVVHTNKTGKVEAVEVKVGHPLLVDAARVAVSHWQYKPFYILSEPVPLEFKVTVNFNMVE